MDIDDLRANPPVTLTMHQLAKAIAAAIGDYAVLIQLPLDRAMARIALGNGLAAATWPMVRDLEAAGQMAATVPIGDALDTLPAIVLPPLTEGAYPR